MIWPGFSAGLAAAGAAGAVAGAGAGAETRWGAGGAYSMADTGLTDGLTGAA